MTTFEIADVAGEEGKDHALLIETDEGETIDVRLYGSEVEALASECISVQMRGDE